MPRVKVDVKNKLGQSVAIEIQTVAMGQVYTFVGGQEAEITNQIEYARVCQIPGVTIMDGSKKPAAPPIPSPGRPRKF